jgi:hypothetical protein
MVKGNGIFPIINESPETFEAHFGLEIDPSFGLILCWKGLHLDNHR